MQEKFWAALKQKLYPKAEWARHAHKQDKACTTIEPTTSPTARPCLNFEQAAYNQATDGDRNETTIAYQYMHMLDIWDIKLRKVSNEKTKALHRRLKQNSQQLYHSSHWDNPREHKTKHADELKQEIVQIRHKVVQQRSGRKR